MFKAQSGRVMFVTRFCGGELAISFDIFSVVQKKLDKEINISQFNTMLLESISAIKSGKTEQALATDT